MEDKEKKGTTQKASGGTPMDPRNGTGPADPPTLSDHFRSELHAIHDSRVFGRKQMIYKWGSLLGFFYFAQTYLLSNMTFLQTDIDPLFLRERHLRLSKSNSSLNSSDSTSETDSSKPPFSLVKGFFNASSLSSPMVASRSNSQQSRKENLDRLVSFYHL